MTTVSVGLNLEEQSFPASEFTLPVQYVLTVAENGATLTSANGTFIFDGVAPGVYNCSIQAVDSSPNTLPIGAPVTIEVTVPVPQVQVAVPTSAFSTES